MTTLGLGGASPVDVRSVTVDSAGTDYIPAAGLYAVVYVKDTNNTATEVQVNGVNYGTFLTLVGVPVYLNAGDVYAFSGGAATGNVFVAEYNLP